MIENAICSPLRFFAFVPVRYDISESPSARLALCEF